MTGERGPDRLARDNLDVHYGPGSRTSRTAGARTDPATGASPAGLELTPLAYHGKRATGQPMARLSRLHRGCRACGPIQPPALCQAHPRRKPRQPAATSWTVWPAKDCNPAPTPMIARLSAVNSGEKRDAEDHELYRTLVGSLLYLSCWSRPDISFAVSELSRFVAAPGHEHLVAAKHLLRYLKGTNDLGIVYSRP